MRENVSSEFKNIFDILVQDKTLPTIQTDLKENANRARVNKLKSVKTEMEILANQYIRTDGPVEKEEFKKALQDIWLTGKQISPQLFTDQLLDEKMLGLVASDRQNLENNYLKKMSQVNLMLLCKKYKT